MKGPPAVVVDLDGVVWRGERPVPGAAAAIGALRDAGTRVAFVTNNSSPTVAENLAKLAGVGIPADPADLLSSAGAAASLLRRELEPGSRVLPCAGPGVVEALTAAGFAIAGEPPVDAVVVGFHRDFDFAGLDRASSAVRAGARFVATNTDATYPDSGRLLPGAGAIVAAVAMAAGRDPEVAGKPAPATVALVRERLGTAGVVIGDRPSTDGALAAALGWTFALVLSGVTSRTPGPGGEPVPEPPPPLVADDLAALVPALLAGAPQPGGRDAPR